GRVENEGLWEIFADPACHAGSEGIVRVPVNVPVGGKLLVSTNGFVRFIVGSSLDIAGELEIQSGGQLHFENSGPARDLTVSSAAVLTGDGTLRMDGSNRLIVSSGDLDTTVAISLLDSAQLIVPGTYTIRTSRSISGTVQAPQVIITTNAAVTVNSAGFTGRVQIDEGGAIRVVSGSASFQSDVIVAAGARLDADVGSPTVIIGGVLTNRGTMHWISDCNLFDLQGSGRVENEGLWEIFADPACHAGSEGIVRVPVNVPAGGKLLVSTNGFVRFIVGSSLNIAGELEIQSGGQLHFENSGPARDLTVSSAAVLTGDGTLRMDGSNRLIVTSGDLDTSVAISLLDSAQLIVPGTYTIRTSRSISGTVQAPQVIITTNAAVTVNSAGFTGRVQID